jgi:hypothetical protein
MSDTLGDPHAPPLIGALLRTTKAKAVLAGYAIATLVCAFLPLIDHLGFEFASVMTWVSAVLAPFVGFAAMELEQRVDAGQRRPARAAATAGLPCSCRSC